MTALPHLNGDSRLTDLIASRFPSLTGRKNPHPLDRPWGHCIQEVHVSQRRVELRHCDVGGHGVWRAALLGHEQPRGTDQLTGTCFCLRWLILACEGQLWWLLALLTLGWLGGGDGAISSFLLFFVSSSGHEGHQRGVQAPRSNGLSVCHLSADAPVLAARPVQTTPLLRHCQLFGQAATKSGVIKTHRQLWPTVRKSQLRSEKTTRLLPSHVP